MKKLKDFIVNDYLSGLPFYDIGKLEKIPLEKFRRMYIENMQTYFNNHTEPTIECWKCREDITSADDLARRYGRSLHVDCFKVEYGEERETDKERERRYFDLVLKSLDVKPAN